MASVSIVDPTLPIPQDWLQPLGDMRLMTATEIDQYPRDSVRLWCHRHARYGLPTRELVQWLRDHIGARKALEIGAGAGDLCSHLGIHGTDSKIQNKPVAAAYYRLMGQPAIRYPAWVEELDALDAIRRYQPEVVIASWVTNWIDPRKPPPPGGGCMFGVREDQLLARGVEYVMIGNLKVHAHKPILRLPHQEIALPSLRSRAIDQSADRIFVWRHVNSSSSREARCAS